MCRLTMVSKFEVDASRIITYIYNNVSGVHDTRFKHTRSVG